MMRIAEIFGPTVQGEGPSAGRQACFLRLSGCNLDCSWCDTPYTWDWEGRNGVAYDQRSEMKRLTVLDASDRLTLLLATMADPLLVVTGGEPLIQMRALLALADVARERAWRVEVETNGTIAPHPHLLADPLRFNVSPKLANSGVPTNRRTRMDVLRTFAASGRAAFKFVVRDMADVGEVDALMCLLDLSPADVWLMPEGATAEAVTQRWPALVEAALDRGINVSSRLHVLAWGDERGR